MRSKFIRQVKGYKVRLRAEVAPRFLHEGLPAVLPQSHASGAIDQGRSARDARWIGNLMGCLSPELIADAFRDTQEQV